MVSSTHWAECELFFIAGRIRLNLVGRSTATLEEYVISARSKQLSDIGKFEVWIVKNEPRMRRYLPDEIVDVLSERAPKQIHYDENLQNFIRENHFRGYRWLAGRLYVTEGAIKHQFVKLHLKVPRAKGAVYSDDELEIVSNSDLEEEGDEDIAQRLNNRNARSVSFKRRAVGLLRRRTFNWNRHPEAWDYVLANYRQKNYSSIAEHLGLSMTQVRKKAWNSGLRKR